MLRNSLRAGAALSLVCGLGLIPAAAHGTSPTAPPYPVTTPYIPGATTATPIQHLVVIFQENVSFDHYFGTYPLAKNPSGEPSFSALPNTPVPNNYFSNPSLATNNPNKDHAGNTINPYRLDRSQAVTCDQDHNYNDEQKMFNGNSTGTSAAMDKFVVNGSGFPACTQLPPGTTDQGAETMGYFDGNTVTGLWNLAQHFSMSDNSFSSTFGPSTPGALNLVAGETSQGSSTPLTTNVPGNTSGQCTTTTATATCSAAGNFSSTNNSVVGDPDPLGDDCASPTRTQVQFANSSSSNGPLTIGDVLSSANISWGWFQGGFRPTSVSSTGTATCGASHLNLAGNVVKDYNAHHAAFQYFPTTANPHHVSPSSPGQIGQNDPSGTPSGQAVNHQYDQSDFYTALQANNLPAVTFLKGAQYQDGHAGTTEGDPLGEQTFVSDVVNSVEQSSAWQSTAIVVMYDDSDGWYDHVFHPPVNTSADPQYDFLNSSGGSTGSACGTPGQPGQFAPRSGFQDRCGPGPRQPLLVISPWVKQNYIDHTFTDQTSVIKFIEENWGVGGLGGGAFESLSGLQSNGSQSAPGSSNPGDLMSLFDFNPRDQRAPAVFLNDQTGQIVSSPQGPPGPPGPQGPAGPTGPKGNPGTTPHVVCKVRMHGHKINVTCVETGSHARREAPARARLTRGHSLLAAGSGTVARINMHARARLRHGVYLLQVTVPGAATDEQVVSL
jgi:phospholipase C